MTRPSLAPFLPAVLLGVSLLSAGCGDPATPRQAAIEASLERARVHLEHGSAELAALDRAWQIARAEAAFENERRRWVPWTGSHESDLAWQEATRIAWRGARLARVEAAGRSERWALAAADARDTLDRARSVTSRLPRRDVAELLRLADGSLRKADAFAGRGDLASALAEAEASLAHSERVLELSAGIEARFENPALRRQWRIWVEETLERSRRDRGTAVLVDKQRRRLELYESGRLVSTFPVELGRRGLERKLHSGDKATPEGIYRVTERRDRGQTRYHRAFMLSYPNDEDVRRYRDAVRRGEVPRGASIGGLIEIHGNGGRERDWTDGCVALTDEDMDRLFAKVPLGATVTIVGTKP